MRRDITIRISLIVLVCGILALLLLDTPEVIDSSSPWRWQLLLWPMWLSSLRLVVLWFQTLSHIVYDNSNRHKMSWIFGHLLFGPLSSLYYYFGSGKQQAEQGRDGDAEEAV
jgi:hypothetical protein